MSETVRYLRVADGFTMRLPNEIHWDYQEQAKRSGTVVDFTDALPGCPTCGAPAYIKITGPGVGWVQYECDHEPVYEDV